MTEMERDAIVAVQHPEKDEPTKFANTPENQLVMKYLKEFEERSLEGVLALFTPDAVVHSPMFGRVPAREFYTAFFKDSAKADVALLGVLGRGETASGGAITGYWARFSSTFVTGARHQFDLVAVMELNGGKISAFHIVMDTAFIRSTFEKDTGRAQAGP